MRLPRTWTSLLASALLTSMTAQAQRPACVEVALPATLPEGEAWRALLLQETRPLLEGEAGECAMVEILAERDDSLPMLQVSWSGSTRTLPLVLEELPQPERARASALLARGLLQQVIDQHERDSTEPAANSAEAGANWDQARAEPSDEGANGQAIPIAPKPTDTATQLTPPQLPNADRRRRKSRWDDYNWAWQPDEAARIAAARNDRFMGPDRMRRGSPWSGVASSGTSFGLTGSTPLLLLELGVQQLLASRRVRFGLALQGIFAPARTSTGGPGLRGSIDFRLINQPRARFWLGPGLTIAELVVNGESEEDGSTFRVARPVASADARATVDVAINGQAYLALALEFAYALRYLEVMSGERTLFAYSGPMLGARVGVGF